MKRWYIVIILITLFCSTHAQFSINSSVGTTYTTRFYDPDSTKQPFKALGLSLFPDALIYSINRYIKHSDFSYINWGTIYNNMMFSALWDNDMFGTNLLAHPFHGSLDFTGARVSGMNYWESVPYLFAASAIWELILENEPPSYNDQIATTFGGAILGETTYRLSSLIVDNNDRGVSRVVREIFGTLTSPMNGINRLLTGQMWKHQPYRPAHPSEIIPFKFGGDISIRHLRRFDKYCDDQWSPYIHGWLVYGDPFRKENLRPLDYFKFDFTLDLSAKSAILSSLKVSGLLWGKQIDNNTPAHKDMMWGVFQHFTYKEKEVFGPDSVPAMRYSIPAAVGIGFAYRDQNPKTNNLFEASAHVNAVFLGAAHASYFKLKGREYNFGQGYNLMINLNYLFRNRFTIGMNSEFTQLFTWDGYKKGIVVADQDYRTFNAMGDRGNTIVGIIRPYMQWNFYKSLALNFAGILYLQDNHNCQFTNTHYYFVESNLGLKYTF